MMERSLLGVLYFSGWLQLSTCLLRQYNFVADEMTWTEAQTYCRQKHTDLATIENNDEMNQLINTVSSAGHNSEVWIGLYTEIDWKWSDGFNGTGAQYRNWDTSNHEPNYYIGQLCVFANNKWYDGDCKASYPFMCYRGTQLDPEFVVVETRMTWSSAQRYCRENFIDLATVRNDIENQKVYNLTSGVSSWIGLYRDPNFYWSDQSSFFYSNFGWGANGLGSMRVLCGVTSAKTSGKWQFLSCEERLPFVCHSVLVKREVVKLRLKLEDSSVDLNDRAVKADLLKKLQDRLQEKGVSGVTLKWREQPDGEVFIKERKRRKTEL